MNDGARPRVVVTGVGVVSAWGWGTRHFWDGVLSGKNAFRPLQRFDNDGYLTHLAGEVPPRSRIAPGGMRVGAHVTFADRFALASAREAIEQAGLVRDLSRTRAGVFFGSSTGGMFEAEAYYRTLKSGSTERFCLASLGSQQVSAPAEAVARRFRVTGPVETMSSACSSATLALGAALDALRDGSVRVAIAGGSDSLCRTTYGGFNALRAIDEKPCAPFRSDRAGMSMGEGSAVLVMELAEDAVRRGATPLAEVAGSGASADAHHMTAPDPTGRAPALAIRRALADAGVDANDVDLINAHGTGTELNDLAEYRALADVFGPRVSQIHLTATKASVGHLLGSAGAIEAVATVLSLQHQRVHPTPGGDSTDPQTPVRLVTTATRPTHPLEVAISLNLAFGGCNAALVLSRWSHP